MAYQIQKLNKNDFKSIDTIFVGDSSCGNAISSKFFDSISNLKSKNLALSRSFGLLGSVGMIKKSLEKNPEIKNIIIIHTLDIWDDGYSKESILELFSFKEIKKYLDIKTVFSYYFNLKEITWHAKFIMNKFTNKKLKYIDIKNDYIKQENKKYSNKKIKVDGRQNLNNIKISKWKFKELSLLQELCQDKKLNCLFLNGPIHKEVIQNSKIFVNYMNNQLSNQFSKIKYFQNVSTYEGTKMGDTYDHIDNRFKNEVTYDYYNIIKNYLKYRG